jgi:hypothetical protein
MWKMERTTDLIKVKNGQPFTWGSVVQIHEIGEYSIVESTQRDDNTASFHPYVNGKDFNRSFETLDIALLAAIAHKYEGDLNSQAVWYMCKMLGIWEATQ